MTIRIFVAALLFSIACRREPAVPAQTGTATATRTTTVAAPPRDLEGQKVDTTVTIPPAPVSRCDVKERFAANEPIDFTMHLTQAPAELQVSVRVMRGDEEVTVVRQSAEGKSAVTLRIPRLEAGRYRLEGMWGGNRACEMEIEVGN